MSQGFSQILHPFELFYGRCLLVRHNEHFIKFLQLTDLLQVLQVILQTLDLASLRKRKKAREKRRKKKKICDEYACKLYHHLTTEC